MNMLSLMLEDKYQNFQQSFSTSPASLRWTDAIYFTSVKTPVFLEIFFICFGKRIGFVLYIEGYPLFFSSFLLFQEDILSHYFLL